VSFVAITRCVTSQRVFIIVIIVVVDFAIGSVRKLSDTPLYIQEVVPVHHHGGWNYGQCNKN